MITSEAQLQQVLEQMARMYRALRSIQEREQAVSPAWYAVLAEGPIEELRKLQQEVDAYVGLTVLREQEADVWVRIHGPEIVWDDAPTSVLTTLLDAFRKGVQMVAEFVDTGTLNARPTKELLEACDLRLVGLAPGSVQVGLRLPTEPDATPPGASKRRVVEEALAEYLEVASWAAEDGEASLETRVPDPRRRKVLINALKPLVPRKRGSVDFVELRGKRTPGRGAVRLTRDAHDRLDRAFDRLVTERTQTMTGVLFEIDLDASTFLLRESEDAHVVRCSFAEEFYELAKAALDRRVLVSGTIRLREGRRGASLLNVTRLEILDDGQGDEETGGDARGGGA